MNTESYELAYIEVKDGTLRIGVGYVSRKSECFYENVTIEYHDDYIVVHGYQRGAKWHSDWDEDTFGTINLHFTDKFCIKDQDWYEKKSRWPFSKPKKRLRQGYYLRKEAPEKLVISNNYIITNHG